MLCRFLRFVIRVSAVLGWEFPCIIALLMPSLTLGLIKMSELAPKTKRRCIPLVGIGLVELAGIGFAIYSVRAADAAMDKSGVGDYAEFAHWTSSATIVFWTLGVAWIAGMLYAAAIGSELRRKVILGVAYAVIPALVFVAAYVACLLFG